MNFPVSASVARDLVEQLPDNPLERKLVLLEALKKRRKLVKLEQYDPVGKKFNRPHHKQVAFHLAGFLHRVRAFFGGNRTGKSVGGGAEDAYHATGLYPWWWKGRRFTEHTRGRVASDTAESTRDGIQRVLLGPPGEWGTGLIPKHLILSITRKRGVADAVDVVTIQHVTGGVSEIDFKSYDQGRKKFQAVSLHWIHLDEEPPKSVYDECYQRIADTEGILYLTMTPLSGMSDVAMMFFGDEFDASNRYRIQAGWQDNPWLSPAVVEEMRKELPPHELEAREHGRPQLGAGKIYPFVRDQVVVPTFQVPRNWPRGIGMDFGWNWTAASVQCYDEEGDIIYVYGEYKQGQLPPVNHAAAIKAFGNIPIWGDPSGNKSNELDGKKVIKEYGKAGLDIKLADNSVAAGILDCYQRIATGRLKIMGHCVQTLQEFDLYHRDEKGKIVKKNDHLLDALRYDVRSVYRFEVIGNPFLTGGSVGSRQHEPADTGAGY